MTCCFQRARSPEQKAERRAQILEAAAEAIAKQPFQSIVLADIARQSGVTKAALYRYFPSKEALFLALYLGELERLTEGMVLGDGPMWAQLSSLLSDNPLFCRLTAILHSVLEQNLDEEQAIAFKQALFRHFARLSQRLQQHYGLPEEQVLTYLLQVQQSIIGCWIMSHPAPLVERVIARPPLDVFRVDFTKALAAQLKALQEALP